MSTGERWVRLLAMCLALAVMEAQLDALPVATAAQSAWATYHSRAYGFTFSYPSVYDEPAYRQLCAVQVSGREVHLGARISLLVRDSRGPTLEQEVQRILAGKAWTVTARSARRVGGARAITVEYRFGGLNRYGTFTVVRRGNRTFIFQFTAGASCDVPARGVREIDAYRRLLDSFRFDP